jgi:hypothetical protein
MRPVNIDLHIEELVLHGFAPSDRHHIADAVEGELERLFVEQWASPLLMGEIEAEHLDGGTFEMTHGAKAGAIGAQIAQAVYRACAPRGVPAPDGAGRAGTSPAPTRLSRSVPLQ